MGEGPCIIFHVTQKGRVTKNWVPVQGRVSCFCVSSCSLNCAEHFIYAFTKTRNLVKCHLTFNITFNISVILKYTRTKVSVANVKVSSAQCSPVMK